MIPDKIRGRPLGPRRARLPQDHLPSCRSFSRDAAGGRGFETFPRPLDTLEPRDALQQPRLADSPV
eukprot:7810100-Pyramimonas_sp.AAC.1